MPLLGTHFHSGAAQLFSEIITFVEPMFQFFIGGNNTLSKASRKWPRLYPILAFLPFNFLIFSFANTMIVWLVHLFWTSSCILKLRWSCTCNYLHETLLLVIWSLQFWQAHFVFVFALILSCLKNVLAGFLMF